MSISSRIHDTLEGWSAEWKDRLGGWMAGVAESGMIKMFDFLEPELREEVKGSMNKLRENPDLPPEIKGILDKAVEEPHAVQFAAILPYLVGILIGLGMGAATPAMRWGGYQMDKLMKTARLEPISAITAFRRNPEQFEALMEDLKELGWNDQRIEALKEVTLYYPSPSEAVEWTAKEAFEPDAIEKYGLDQEFELLDLEFFKKIGVPDWVLKFNWRAHWQHASWQQVLDMYHRDLITYDDIWEWFRLVEVPPYWRDKLIAITWDLPNRVETRMMARYGLVDKAWLVEHLKRIGLHEDYRDVTADFMLAMGIRTDLSTRFSKGWIDADGVQAEINKSGLSPEIGERLYQWIVSNTENEGVGETKALNESVIVKAVKDGKISREEGIELLMRDRNYSREDAEFVLDVKVGALGSPETYFEFKEVIEKHRKAHGLDAHIPDRELVEAGKALRKIELEYKALEEKKGKDKAEAELGKELSDAKYLYHQLFLKFQEEAKPKG